jgi:WD40 repeat protein
MMKIVFRTFLSTLHNARAAKPLLRCYPQRKEVCLVQEEVDPTQYLLHPFLLSDYLTSGSHPWRQLLLNFFVIWLIKPKQPEKRMNPQQFNSSETDQNYGTHSPNAYSPYSNAINNELQKLQQSPTLTHRYANTQPQEQPISANAFENALKRTLQIGSDKDGDTQTNGAPKSTSPIQTLKRQESPKLSNDTQQISARKERLSAPKKDSTESSGVIQASTFKREIKDKDFTYQSTFGKTTGGEARPKVNSNTITFYQTDPVFNAGKMITTSNNYLLWGIRGGLLRVFHKFNCKNAVMKGHKQQVTDVKFYNSQSNFVVSTSRDRSLILWEVSEKKGSAPVQNGPPSDGGATQPAPEKQTGLGYKIQLYVQTPMEQNHKFFKRFEWQPRRDARIIYAVSSVNEIFAINLDVLLANAKIVNDIRFINFVNNIEGVTLLHEGGDDIISDIRFSNDSNSELFVAVTESGKIIVFNTSTLTKVYEQYLYPQNSTPIWSIHFCGSKVRPNLYNSFITGTNKNNDFALWQFPDRNFTGENTITKVQTVSIIPSSNIAEKETLSFTNTVELDTSSACLFIASLETPTLLALHIGDTSIDHIAEFETNYPIVSFKSMTKFNENDKNYMIGLFCLESEAVQLVSVTINDILSPSSGDEAIQPQQQQQAPPELPQQAKTQKKPTTPLQTSPHTAPTITPPQEISPISSPSSASGGSVELKMLLKEFQKMEKRITTRMEETIEKQTQKQYDNLYHRLERERLLRVKEERQKQEELLDTIAKAISQDIPNDVVAIIEERVVPAIGDEIEARLNDALQQSLEKNFQSIGPVVEQSIVNSVRQPIQESFQQVLKNTVIPSFQLSCQKMFTQISQTFDSGMEERIKKPLRDHYTALNQETLQLIDQHLKQFATGAQASHSAPSQSYEPSVPHPVSNQQTSQKDKISHLLRSGRFDEAFTIALSSNDLKMVIWTCELTTPDRVLPFLSQPVLLSLIQQVAFDLKAQLDLKLDWIEKSILALDPNDEAISSHVQPILQSVLVGLQRAFSVPENSDPTNIRSQKLKLLMHVVNSQLYGAKKE